MVEKYRCVGCAACASVCPTNALHMEKDNEGFYYALLNQEKCIDCNLCKKVCPALQISKADDREIEFYAMKNRNKCTQINSASGGVFPEIAKWILSQKGFVWGAAFDEMFNVKHRCISSEHELPLLCRSKYVQSDMRNVYKTIKKQLNSGAKVLFSGTPCQTTALAKFIGDRLCPNLYLVDIVCHGVPSPDVWKEYLKELCGQEYKTVEDIESIYFKYKVDDKTWMHPGFCIKWKDGTDYLNFSNNTWYEKGFLGNLYVRPSCHKCLFKCLQSVSDMTIGDFWGCKELYPKFFDKNGVSLAIVKTKKGEYIKRKLEDNMELISISKKEAFQYNARLIEASQENPKRKKFWEKYSNMEKSISNMEVLIEQLTYFSFYDRVKNKIRKILDKK